MLHRSSKFFSHSSGIFHRTEIGILRDEAVQRHRRSGDRLHDARWMLRYRIRVEESWNVEMKWNIRLLRHDLLGRNGRADMRLVSIWICVVGKVVKQLLLLSLIQKVGESAREMIAAQVLRRPAMKRLGEIIGRRSRLVMHWSRKLRRVVVKRFRVPLCRMWRVTWTRRKWTHPTRSDIDRNGTASRRIRRADNGAGARKLSATGTCRIEEILSKVAVDV